MTRSLKDVKDLLALKDGQEEALKAFKDKQKMERKEYTQLLTDLSTLVETVREEIVEVHTGNGMYLEPDGYEDVVDLNSYEQDKVSIVVKGDTIYIEKDGDDPDDKYVEDPDHINIVITGEALTLSTDDLKKVVRERLLVMNGLTRELCVVQSEIRDIRRETLTTDSVVKFDALTRRETELKEAMESTLKPPVTFKWSSTLD